MASLTANWEKKRQVLLAILSAGVILSSLHLLINPSAGKRQVSLANFPETIPLSKWQQKSTQSLDKELEEENIASNSGFIEAKEYNYQKDGQRLDVNLYYEINSRGYFKTFQDSNSSISLEEGQTPELRQQEGVGSYYIWTNEAKSHLVSCINPRGESTVTPEQFSSNRMKYDLLPQRFLPWILGQETLLDRRCLWVHLSTKDSSPDASYPILEAAWLDLYSELSANFPQL